MSRRGGTGGGMQCKMGDLENLLEELTRERNECGDDAETYTTGYRNGYRNGQIHLLRRLLGAPYADGENELV